MDLINILAILLSPLIAVQVTQWINKLKAAKDRKIKVFSDLMATRGTALSPKHVEALNRIDIEYYGVNKVTTSWKIYMDHLDHVQNILSEDEADWKSWGAKREELLTSLLGEMANHLKYKFDPVQLKRGHYNPTGYVNFEAEQQIIRKGLVELFQNKKPLPIWAIVANPPPSVNEPKLAQEAIEKKQENTNSNGKIIEE